MKKISTFVIAIIVVFSFSACSKSSLEIAKEKIETTIKSNMNDPDSYEFVSIELIDSIAIGEIIEYKKESFEKTFDTKFTEQRLEAQKNYLTDYERQLKTEKYDNVKKMIRENIERNKNEIEKYKQEKEEKEQNLSNSLKKLEEFKKSIEYLNENVVFIFRFDFRGMNAFGAKVLNTKFVYTNSEFEPFEFTDERTKIYYFEEMDNFFNE